MNYGVSTPDSHYYYTVTPQGNAVAVSNQIKVRTLINSGVNEQFENNLVSWSVSNNGINLSNLPIGCTLNLIDLLGKRMQTIQPQTSVITLIIPQKGIYLLQIQNKQEIRTLKIRY